MGTLLGATVGVNDGLEVVGDKLGFDVVGIKLGTQIKPMVLISIFGIYFLIVLIDEFLS